jgi:hypothetical protein
VPWKPPCAGIPSCLLSSSLAHFSSNKIITASSRA